MVDEFVNKLDLTELIERYEDDGKPPYHPKDLLKIIILAYAENEYGCRGIARLASYDFAICTCADFPTLHLIPSTVSVLTVWGLNARKISLTNL